MNLKSQDLTQPNDLLPLLYIELIDWNHDAPIHIPKFHDDEDIVNFLFSSSHENNYPNGESHVQDFDREGSNFLSCKINNIKD
jgi:hypothetical protein